MGRRAQLFRPDSTAIDSPNLSPWTGERSRGLAPAVASRAQAPPHTCALRYTATTASCSTLIHEPAFSFDEIASARISCRDRSWKVHSRALWGRTTLFDQVVDHTVECFEITCT